MPDRPNFQKRPHPVGRVGESPEAVKTSPRGRREGYVELRCKSNFSFLRGASHPEELVEQAVRLGHSAIALTDLQTLAGAVRMHCAAKASGIKLILGAEINPIDAPPIILYAPDRAAYGRLSRIISLGRLRAIKGECHVRFDDIAANHQGLIAAMLDDRDRYELRVTGYELPITYDPAVLANCQLPIADWEDGDGFGRLAIGNRQSAIPSGYRDLFGDRLYLSASVHGGAEDGRYLEGRMALAKRLGMPLLANNDVHYHVAERRFLQDVLTCIRLGCTLESAGEALFANAERHLKATEEMLRLFSACPEAVRRTLELAERCTFTLDELRYEYPESLCPPESTPRDYLRELTWQGVDERYPRGVPAKVRKLIEHELQLIGQLSYEPYFLTVWDIVQFARSQDILCQGRGSAANSAVCYCLGITSVDPDRVEMLFERFVSAERNEPPDIDVDFEHERREEVFQYIYNKYGRDHAGIVAEVITYRPRSAIRDVGKALGLSLDRVDVLAKKHDWWGKEALPDEFLREAGLDPQDRTMQMLMRLVRLVVGFPRHLSQHVGGFVITRGLLSDLVPLQNGAMPGRTFIEWDKDDIDALGLLKMDCLALGMLTAIKKTFEFLPTRTELHQVPPEDPAVYDMICHGDTVGVFQIESRAQMSMLPRLKPRNYYDLVIEVAIVRPGPIQGGMVHPYLRRRCGEEAVTYPSEAIRGVLERTLGVPLFQEQAMSLAIVAAGFTPGEADQLRRAMAAWRRNGAIEKFKTKLITGMTGSGLSEEFAERCFQQICGFGEYGFPESHAASFALLVYVSAWLKRYHPAAFCAALLNSQPMGFYQPAQLVRDAKEHGVTVLPVDVNESEYDCRLAERDCRLPISNCRLPRGKPIGNWQSEISNPSGWGMDGPALRLGMRLVKGVSREQVTGIEQARGEGAFTSLADVHRRTGAGKATLARLAAADAFGSMGMNRREAVWQALALSDEPPLLADLEPEEPFAELPPLTLRETVLEDYDTTGLSLNAHPMSLIRADLDRLGVTINSSLKMTTTGRRMTVSGIVLVRQRPSTANGILFCTIEDETAAANLIVRPAVFEKYRRAAGAAAIIAHGKVERQGEVVHLLVERIEDVAEGLASFASRSRDFR